MESKALKPYKSLYKDFKASISNEASNNVMTYYELFSIGLGWSCLGYVNHAEDCLGLGIPLMLIPSIPLTYRFINK